MPENNTKGGRKPRVEDSDILEVFKETADPVLSTAEVADAVPIKRRGTLNRLQSLKEEGELESKQIGGRNTVWWLPSDAGARKPTDSMRTAESTPQQEGTKTTSQPLPESDSPQSHQKDSYSDVSFPGSKDRQECIAAIDAVGEYLKAKGPASMSDIVQEVMPEYSAGYDAESDVRRIQNPDERNRSTWWRKVIRPGLEARDDIQKPPKGGSRWRYEKTT